MLEDFKLILPEFSLLLIILIGQLSALFIKNQKLLSGFFLTALVFLTMYCFNNFNYVGIGFDGSFVYQSIHKIAKALFLFFSILIIIFYQSYCDIKKIPFKIEFITILLLSVLGMMLLISAHNFILWFCAFELQSLTSYVLAAFNTNSKASSKAGLKYFILGALMSCIGVFGISFIYGFSGSLDFSLISSALNNGHTNIGLTLGIIFVLINILFKLSAVPFHFWAPDVYEGAPIYSVCYFSTISTFGFLIVLLNFISIDHSNVIILKLLKITAILSMVLGSLGALQQKSIKKLIAYSTILNTGYCLIGVCCNTPTGSYAALVNMFIYIVSVIALFSCLLAATSKNIDNLTFNDIQGLGASKKALAAVIAITMFSMIGVPPVAGFFGKYNLFFNAIHQGEYLLAIIGIITSVISAFYYLKIIKTLYFMDSIDNYEKIITQRGLMFISIISTSFILLYSLFAL